MDDKITQIDADAHVAGTLKGKNARVRGRFKGNIELSGRLLTNEGSRVEATASVNSAEIAGRYDGELRAKSALLLEKASFTGKLYAASLAVREGARINGRVTAGEKTEKSLGHAVRGEERAHAGVTAGERTDKSLFPQPPKAEAVTKPFGGGGG